MNHWAPCLIYPSPSKMILTVTNSSSPTYQCPSKLMLTIEQPTIVIELLSLQRTCPALHFQSIGTQAPTYLQVANIYPLHTTHVDPLKRIINRVAYKVNVQTKTNI